MPRPKVYDDDLRRRLVARAAAGMAEAGIDSLSLRALALAEDTSTNAVYALFGSKDDLIDAVLEAAASGFTAAQASVPTTGDPLANLVALGHAYRSWVMANPALYSVLMGGRDPAAGHRGDGWTPDRTAGPLLAGVRRALEQGALVADDPWQVALTLWAGVHGMVSLEAALWGDLPVAERDRRFDEHIYALACRWIP